ncbi:prepilin-type N-terminal cleavage/methylation domain-containing protein [Caldicellulosiruptor naganoensis]|uniref:Prepilin-type N-terminal cleavage/methylation domain-containing protein n=1 Tax=Caldicellulosiruptor naganoensis TaxID=29324 RepID=A0ABY7BIS2_9FIRM|nr:prepilin-type N-terminal cleavage/methylation domain-containing protein [Caldicellulosiruptor naganoensis]WAM32308.1 prepilin-type N-terminal cleavage/methylation domain-containing protein [Caldicellulosiruptor naganoensis]
MKYRGFSLSEMIIVIVIIAILLAIGIPAYLSSVRRAEVRNVANGLSDVISMLYEYEDKEAVYDKYFVKINNYIIPDPATGERYLQIQLIKYVGGTETVLKELKSKTVELNSDIIVTGAGPVATYLYYDKNGTLWKFSGSPGLRANESHYQNTNKEIVVKARGATSGYQKRVIIKALPPGSVEVK